ncbi:hypothetical protein NQ318_014459 [Aromia moschata]|uniref:Mos1 transposase HTH domain-containing protein n=1 Tax=Aromia moschata TaxID=1265417 RepID=A0AAV8XU60_9CUCU|nr:hypothetical protein NQ318_014459 [Aromia moschata]
MEPAAPGHALFTRANAITGNEILSKVIHVLVRCAQLKELLLLPKVCVKTQEPQLVTEHNNLMIVRNILKDFGVLHTKAYAMLKEVYGNDGLSRAQVFEWFKRFKEGRETTEDDPRPGRSATSETDENIEKSGKSIREDRRLGIRRLAKITGIDKECVRQILHESFNMRKNGAKIPHSRAKGINN